MEESQEEIMLEEPGVGNVVGQLCVSFLLFFYKGENLGYFLAGAAPISPLLSMPNSILPRPWFLCLQQVLQGFELLWLLILYRLGRCLAEIDCFVLCCVE